MTDLVIDELKEIYNRENNRKQSIENKTSYLVGVISIVITVLISKLDYFTCLNNKLTFNLTLYVSSLICLGISIIICLIIFYPRNFQHPFNMSNFKNFEKKFEKNDKKFRNNLKDLYIISNFNNHDINNCLLEKLNYAVLIFIISIIFLIILIILQITDIIIYIPI
jgi:anaerobic C4-dicarboxylate transporter